MWIQVRDIGVGHKGPKTLKVFGPGESWGRTSHKATFGTSVCGKKHATVSASRRPGQAVFRSAALFRGSY
jgi:hypothetical protein